ncbi:amino acid ABC transporter ATP-binding protein (PAAT family) [Sinobacterium caligoides]|uniref:Amino acid ABC transporter ATP-binding protein (PAAT family) n=1 Tax=Sinobacterium caligoides TaxID=933926 RepID=A0A3N2DJD1_9GAMM|nr:amino acid ABC transporter ATP-binding protein [Sinobacterium caligoides]ROR99910.1 amino acid ABC transporter ATP-binding protein (PAAT family) [Sinobacterium caligoides]
MFSLRGISKQFGDHSVLKNIDLDIASGEIVVLVGSSGTGKSTLLRCCNLLETPDSGVIRVGDFQVDATNITRHAAMQLRRRAAFVFQNYGLFKNKRALENITEGLIVVQGMKKEAANVIGREVLDKVGLSDRADAWPSQLSGGQQQRIGIGRALAQKGDILIMDEPTSALDPELTVEVQELIKLLAKEQTTMLITTHDMAFAAQIASRIVFMADGEIIEQGSPEQMINHAKDKRAQRFFQHYC